MHGLGSLHSMLHLISEEKVASAKQLKAAESLISKCAKDTDSRML